MKKHELHDLVESIYADLRRDFTADNFPDVFGWLETFNAELAVNPLAFSSAAHPLMLTAHPIFQTPIKFRPKIMLIGDANSWFDKSSAKRALTNLAQLSGGIPKVNSYLEHGTTYSSLLQKIFGPDRKGFEGLGKLGLLSSCVGLNRLWLQVGTKDSLEHLGLENISSVTKRVSPTLKVSFKYYCESRTRTLIEAIAPEKLILLGANAQAIYTQHSVPEDVVLINSRDPSRGGERAAAETIRQYLIDG